MHRFVPLLTLLACPAPDTGESGETGAPPDRAPLAATEVTLLPAGQPNLLVPIEVGLDAGSRRLWVSSNGFPHVAEVDLDAQALVAVYDLPELTELHPLVAADQAGAVWFAFRNPPAIQRFDPATGTLSTPSVPVSEVHTLVAAPGGGVVAGGLANDKSGDHLLALSADHDPVVTDVAGSVLSVDADVSDGVNVLLRETTEKRPTTLVTLNGQTLEEQARCDLSPDSRPTAGFSWIDELPGRGFVISQGTLVAVLDCPSGTWTAREEGAENRSVFGLGPDAFVVLDRLGGADTNWGAARYYGADLAPSRAAVQVGKNSGYAARDPVTGLLWMNSEGTAEVWAYDPDNGTVAAKVRLGEHVESLVANPADDHHVYFTGRLSSAFGMVNLDSGEVERVSDTVTWPVSPVFLDGRLFVLDELVDEVVELDPDTLAVLSRAPTGLGANAALTLSDLAADADNHRLYIVNGGTGEVVALDPDMGVVAGPWTLLPAPTDADTPGRAELAVVDGIVLAARNSDGLLARLDPSSGTIATGTLSGAGVRTAVRGHALDALWLSDDGKTAWLGPSSFDTTTLAPLVDLDFRGFILADDGDTLLGWTADPPELLRLSPTGEVLARSPTEAAPWGAPGFARRGTGPDAGVLLGSYDRASIQYVPAPH